MTEVIADELNREGGPKGVKLVALSGPCLLYTSQAAVDGLIKLVESGFAE